MVWYNVADILSRCTVVDLWENQRGSAMCFWLILTIFSEGGVLYKLGGWEAQRRHLGGDGGPSPPRKKKKKKEWKKEKRERKEKKEKKRKKGTMDSVKLLHMKCCFFLFFNSPVALKNKKNLAPQEKVEMTPLERHQRGYLRQIEHCLYISYFCNVRMK